MLKVLEFDVLKDMEAALQGGIAGGRIDLFKQGRASGLDGTTLVLTIPLVTVTFSDTSGVGLLPQDIVNQIVAASADLAPFWRDRHLHLVQTAAAQAAGAATRSGGISLSHTGTANPIFGFSTSADSAGTSYNSYSGAVPRLVETNNKSRLDGYYAVVEV